jgi:arylsulfatase A-like enzyme/Flp pilus assembly protein TadD
MAGYAPRMAFPSLSRALAATTASLLLAAASGCQPPRSAQGHHLVLISLDTVRADHLGAYGFAQATTPALDGLAQRGVRWTQVSAAAPLTLPSHATLMTGLVPPRHGLRLNGLGALPAGLPTLAQHLAAQGYDTAAFVGAFVLDHRFGLDRGFARYDDEIRRNIEGQAPRLEAERPAGAVIDRALAWLKSRPDPDKPFFVWIHLYDAHAPYQPPEPFLSRHAGRPYDGEIASVDHEVGRLLAALQERGVVDRTVVSVVADHGESLGEHGEQTHGLLLYQPALHVPWLLSAPGVVAEGEVVDAPAGLVDVAPTLAALLGAPWPVCAPPGCGRDLTPLLRGGEVPAGEPSPLYAETEYPATFGWSPLAALRVGDLKLIASPRPELFDLARDERETANRAEQERRAYRELDTALQAIRAATTEIAAATPDAEALSRLAALGYVGGGQVGKRAIGDGAHPSERVADFHRWEALEGKVLLGQPETALDGLRQLVDGDPRNPVFRGSLARLLRKLGHVEQALPLYRQAVADAPTDPDTWHNLAAVLREAGSTQASWEAAKQALRLDGKRPEALNLLGVAELATGDPSSALQRFRAALELDPRNATAWNNLGNVLRIAGQPGQAEHAFRRASELAPAYADPWSGLGALLVEKDRPAEAVPLLRKALELEPGFEEARLNLGIAYQMAGELEPARQTYRELLARTAGQSRFAAQHRAARQLLAGL